MIEDLLKSEQISKEQHDTYVLFELSAMGKKWLKDRTMQTFLEEPDEHNCIGEAFAYVVGRGSLLRNIHAIIDFVNKKLKELDNDRSIE